MHNSTLSGHTFEMTMQYAYIHDANPLRKEIEKYLGIKRILMVK